MTLRLRADDASVRRRFSAEEIRAFLPATGAVGPFRFPEPYGTRAVRLTNQFDGPIEPVGYSYWNNANNHAGERSILVALGRGDEKGLLLEVDKATLAVARRELPIAGTGEGWRFSRRRSNLLYVTEGPVLFRLNVDTFAREVILDLRDHGRGDRVLWQTFSSADDRVHSGTLKVAETYEVLGAFAYDEAARRFLEVPKRDDRYDEAQVDRSGRYLLVKEAADLRVVDLETGASTWRLDADGAPGHSDVGDAEVVGEDDRAPLPGTFRRWRLEPGGATTDGRVVYHTTEWANLSLHASWSPRGSVLISGASRRDLPRANEFVLAPLDGSLELAVVAPNLVDLDADGGGGDDYRKLPKANVDPTGTVAVWTANCGGDRIDAFLVLLDDAVGPELPAPAILPPNEDTEETNVNGLIARQPYPYDSMADAIAVVPGSPLTLLRADPTIQTQDPATGAYRPSAAGDVLSRTPGKVWEGRPPGSNGAWEQYSTNGPLAVFNPLGDPAQSEAFVYWPQVPNL